MINNYKSTDRPVAIYFAFISDIKSLDKTSPSLVKLQFVKMNKWQPLPNVIGTIKVSEKPQPKREGKLYTTKIELRSPGHSENSPEENSELTGTPVIIKVKYKSGLNKIIGTLDKPAVIFLDITSQKSTFKKYTSEYLSASPNLWLQ